MAFQNGKSESQAGEMAQAGRQMMGMNLKDGLTWKYIHKGLRGDKI